MVPCAPTITGASHGQIDRSQPAQPQAQAADQEKAQPASESAAKDEPPFQEMNLANASVGQLMIPVDDFDRGLAFYRDVLGLPFLFAAPPQMAFFMCGTVRLRSCGSRNSPIPTAIRSH